MPLLKEQDHFTYADYEQWDTDERYELIEGVPYLMSPGPSQAHQELSSELHRQLANFLKGKPCKVFHAPFDVRLNADEADDTVVQPDLLVVCDKEKLDGKCCKGAPDLVIEILSPSTAKFDKHTKFHQYLRAGVREYWIVDPDIRTVEKRILKDGAYMVQSYADTDTITVEVLDGLSIDLSEVFEHEE